MTQPDAPTTPRRWYTPLLAGDLAALWPAIVVAFIGVLAIAFAMSYHGLYVFGERIMNWPFYLCVLAPVGLDVFSLVGLLATFLTRDAGWRVRLYCWVALLFTVALSIGGNAIAAYSLLTPVAPVADTTFRWGLPQVSAVSGAAIWPALSAVALHVLIVVRRHLDDRRDKVRQAEAQRRAAAEREAEEARRVAAAQAQRERAAAAERQTLAEAEARQAERRAADAEARLRALGEQLQRARAIDLAAEGKAVSDILTALSLDESSRRTVERWTKPVRDALATPIKTTATARVNGRRGTRDTDAGTVPAAS